MRTVLSLVVIPAITAFMGTVAIVGGLFRSHEVGEWATRRWARGLLLASGARVRVTGAEGLDPAGHYIFVANHQSHLDIPAITVAFPGPVRFVAKKSLFSIPVLGQAMRTLGHVPVDRQDREAAQASLAQALEPLRTRVSLLFFAEGTRSVTGELGPFKKGALAMAEAAGVPVVPVAVVGTREVLPKGSLRVRAAPVAVAFGPPMPDLADPGTPRRERSDTLREAVAALMATAGNLRG